MRTQDEILEQLTVIEKGDVLGFGRSVLIDFLDYEHAAPFLKEEVTKAEWDEVRKDEPLAEIRDYLPFAWEKANNYHGISAYRSLVKIEQWAWMSGNEELMRMVNSDSYGAYGKNQLRAVTVHLGMDASQFDDGVRHNSEPSW